MSEKKEITKRIRRRPLYYLLDKSDPKMVKILIESTSIDGVLELADDVQRLAIIKQELQIYRGRIEPVKRLNLQIG